ncbi:MAG: SDR family oxidoreductase, partial [Mesorhizobium sp.]
GSRSSSQHARSPRQRVAEPEEIARSALYLASDASSFTTGAALFADGGVSISRT